MVYIEVGPKRAQLSWIEMNGFEYKKEGGDPNVGQSWLLIVNYVMEFDKN